MTLLTRLQLTLALLVFAVLLAGCAGVRARARRGGANWMIPPNPRRCDGRHM